MSENPLAAALTYAALGYRVLPCHSIINGHCTCGGKPGCKPGKHPLTKHGVKDATTDEATIKSWWSQWPYANVAIATGEKVWVLDEDPRHGGDRTLAALIVEHVTLPSTLTVRTGGGGRQFYLHYPEGAVIRSRSGVAPGLDVRGDGGYVVAPPSAHESGHRYEWLTPIETPLADAPDWLLTMVAEMPVARGVAAIRNDPSRDVPSLTLTMQVAKPCDLASHPGAESGERNDTMCRLLGVHISRGDSPATIEALALSWAARCNPPIPEGEVRQRLKWAESKRTNELTRREGEEDGVSSFADGDGKKEFQPPPPHNLSTPDAGGSGGSDQAAAEPVDAKGAEDWPVLSDDAYHGLAGEIVRTVAPETEADPVGVLLSLLAAFGNAAGKGAQFAVGPQSHHANLFIALVGDTASAKGQAQGIAMYLMRQVAADWEAECVSYGLSSGEGLVDRVRDPEPDDSDGVVLVMPEVKRLLCVEEEFSKPITAMRRDGNTLSAILRAAWDSKPLEVLTRGKSKLLASNAHVSITAHITPEELDKLLGKSVEVANGFANRFLWVCVKRSKLLPHGGNVRVLDGFVEPLRKALTHAQQIRLVRRSAEADALWETVYPGLAEARRGAFGRVTERARPQVMRLALLYALVDCSDVIEVEHLRAALAVWEYCDASAERIFGGEEGQGQVSGGQSQPTVPLPLHLRLLDAIAKRRGISRRGLHEATGNRIKADDMETALTFLEAQRLAHRGLCQPDGGGRPAECWYPGPSDDPEDDDGEFTPTIARIDAAVVLPPGEVTSVGRPASASGETECDAAGLQSNERTPVPPQASEIVSSFAAGHEAGEGHPCPPEDPTPQPLSPLEADPKLRLDKKPRYAVGQYVRTTIVDAPLKVVDVTVYAPTAQYYMLAHDDPEWEPPKDRKLSINMNYDRPRVCVDLSEIVGSAPPSTAPNTGSVPASTKVGAEEEPGQDQSSSAPTPYRCPRCGVAVVESNDAICEPCFRAELDSLARDDAE